MILLCIHGHILLDAHDDNIGLPIQNGIGEVIQHCVIIFSSWLCILIIIRGVFPPSVQMKEKFYACYHFIIIYITYSCQAANKVLWLEHVIILMELLSRWRHANTNWRFAISIKNIGVLKSLACFESVLSQLTIGCPSLPREQKFPALH